MFKRVLTLILSILLITCLCACAYAAGGIPEIVMNTPGSDKWNEKVDYSDCSNWLSLPEVPDKKADLIYFYPTVYSPAADSGEVLAGIDDEDMRVKAAAALEKQATAFADSCNIFAPFYRQLDAVYALTLTDSETAELIRYSASQDAAEALDYYFEHFNSGRPFIIAGHSQGSQTAVFLLADYFRNHPDYYERMIAAYIIGYSVTESFLEANPHIRLAEGETDTGVIVSWNTEGPENIGRHNAVVLDGARSINPINWKTDGTYASAEENKGSRINGEILYNIADARIDTERGTVITNADKSYAMPPNPIFGPASFHTNDYDLFYENLRENVQKRVDAFPGSSITPE